MTLYTNDKLCFNDHGSTTPEYENFGNKINDFGSVSF